MLAERKRGKEWRFAAESAVISSHVPRLNGSAVKPFGRFFGQTTHALTLHPYVPALKVVYRRTVCCHTSATNDRWFSGLRRQSPVALGGGSAAMAVSQSLQSSIAIHSKLDCGSLSCPQHIIHVP